MKFSPSNHYAYGAVAAWLYRSVAGLRPAAPGYRALEIATPYGRASVAWSISGTT